MSLKLPSLAERKEDIPILSKYFNKKFSEINSVPLRQINAEAQDILLQYAWPGNVRELENTIHRAVLLTVGNENY